MDLNITVLMGMATIIGIGIGIGTEMAILLVSGYAELVRDMPPRQAL